MKPTKNLVVEDVEIDELLTFIFVIEQLLVYANKPIYVELDEKMIETF